MTSLQQPLSAIAGRNFAAVDCINHVAAVDMTSLQQSLSARAGSNLAAIDMISLRQSLSIADSHYSAAAIARRNYVAAAGMTSLQQPLPATTCGTGNNFAAVTMISLRQLLVFLNLNSR